MTTNAHGKRFGSHGRRLARRGELRTGFTLIELLVVVSLISLLTAILVPALGKVRQQARRVLSVGNMRQIVTSVNSFADENHGRYPPTVATIGYGDNWNYHEPTYLMTFTRRSVSPNRSLSTYLRSYISDAGTMVCPSAPLKHKYLQEAWDGGETWDNPDIPTPTDALLGTYCFYWNYVGYLSEEKGLFRGPTSSTGSPREGSVLVTDYFGYDHSRNPNAYGSCERFRNATVIEGTDISSTFWSYPGEGTPEELARLDIQPSAGYVDGHVDSFAPADTIPMRVILHPETGQPYDDADYAPGIFYLPRAGVR
ncbi:MAG: type II secretion system protein [Solirubrobacterales bacterium]